MTGSDGQTAPAPAGVPHGYRVLQTFPTNTGRGVHHAVSTDGEDVLLKVAHTKEWAVELQEQARHLDLLADTAAGAGAYPEILGRSARHLVMRYYPHGSLDELSLGDDPGLVHELTRSALATLFRIAAVDPPGISPDLVTTAARDWLPTHAESRLQRLEQAARGVARNWAADRAGVLDRATGWIRDGSLDQAVPRLGPPRLTVAAHGDLGLNNIMLAGPPSPTARTIFIDVRGRWISGWPWWDVVLDLATLISFHCRIEPALGAAGERDPRYATAPGRLTEDRIRAMIDTDTDLAALLADDPGWRERLEVAIAVRLLGNVGVQLLTAPEHGERRADIVLELYVDQLDRVDAALGRSTDHWGDHVRPHRAG
jgi:hypothetical protein